MQFRAICIFRMSLINSHNCDLFERNDGEGNERRRGTGRGGERGEENVAHINFTNPSLNRAGIYDVAANETENLDR